MCVEHNKMLVCHLFEEVWNTGEYESLDEIATPEFAEFAREDNQRVRRACPDFIYRIEDIVAEGNRVVVRWTGRGTHLGAWPTERGTVAPTGRRVAMRAIQIFLIRNGLIADQWSELDSADFYQQLGLYPPANVVALSPEAGPSRNRE